MTDFGDLVNADSKGKFERDGYVVFDTQIPEETLDEAIEELRPYWSGKKLFGVPYADKHRVQDGWRVSDSSLAIAIWPPVLGALRYLYGREPKPFQTLNFPSGTEQRPHSDAIHFNSEPFGLMCGVWIALEDVGQDQGPIVYYPRSHHLPDISFSDIGIKACRTNYSIYENYIQKIIADKKLEPVYATIKKGQALVWAANLLHGGSMQKDKSKSRHSQVTHYYFEGAKPWRPMASERRRHYFDPPGISTETARTERQRFINHRTVLLGIELKNFLDYISDQNASNAGSVGGGWCTERTFALTNPETDARLLKRVFDIDIEHCPNCGGALKIIAAIEDPPVIVKILSHLGLPTRAPPRAPARRVDLFQTI